MRTQFHLESKCELQQAQYATAYPAIANNQDLRAHALYFQIPDTSIKLRQRTSCREKDNTRKPQINISER